MFNLDLENIKSYDFVLAEILKEKPPGSYYTAINLGVEHMVRDGTKYLYSFS